MNNHTKLLVTPPSIYCLKNEEVSSTISEAMIAYQEEVADTSETNKLIIPDEWEIVSKNEIPNIFMSHNGGFVTISNASCTQYIVLKRK